MVSHLLLILIVIPLMELTLLIKAGQYLGSGTTILLVVLTGILGASLAKYQGLKVLWEFRHSISQGIMPGNKLLEGLLVLLGGILLLTPGFVTDTIGFLFLLPTSRKFFAALGLKWIESYLHSGHIRIYRR